MGSDQLRTSQPQSAHLSVAPASHARPMFPFPFDFSEKTRVKFKLHARHPTFLRTVNDRPCETSCETSFIFRRNDLRREIFCVLFSENNLVVICFSGNFFLFCVSFVPNARTKQQKKRNVPRLRSRSESLFLQPDEVLVASSPVCRVVFLEPQLLGLC